jgi:hypothetical protein
MRSDDGSAAASSAAQPAVAQATYSGRIVLISQSSGALASGDQGRT